MLNTLFFTNYDATVKWEVVERSIAFCDPFLMMSSWEPREIN